MKFKFLKIYYIYILVVITFLSIEVSSYVAGPPAGSTNAPGESTCYSGSSCHTGTPNAGPGFGEITIMGGIPAGNFYSPDTTYGMMPYAIDTAKANGGFQIVARLANGTNAGTSIISMAMNTKLVSSGGFDYVEQTSAGAFKPVMSNMHNWMYDWKAPSAGAGTVTFYVAFVSGNKDGTAGGDNIYTDTLVLYEKTSGINENFRSQDLMIERMYPVPVNDLLNIDLAVIMPIEISITIIGINGRVLIQETQIPVNSSGKSHTIDLSGLNTGIYFVKVEQEGKPALYRKALKN